MDDLWYMKCKFLKKHENSKNFNYFQSELHCKCLQNCPKVRKVCAKHQWLGRL